MSDVDRFWDVYAESDPKKLRDMPDESLDAHHQYFVDVVQKVAFRPKELQSALGRIKLIQDTMQERAREKADAERDQTSENRHKETRQTAHRAIRLSKIGLVISGLGVAFALLFGVLSYRANKQPPKPLSASSDSQPSPSPSARTTPSQATPAPTAAQSPTPQPSQSTLLSPTPAR